MSRVCCARSPAGVLAGMVTETEKVAVWPGASGPAVLADSAAGQAGAFSASAKLSVACVALTRVNRIVIFDVRYGPGMYPV